MLYAKCVGTKIQSEVSFKESKEIRNSLKKHEAILLTEIISLMLNQFQFLDSDINFSNIELPEKKRKVYFTHNTHY